MFHRPVARFLSSIVGMLGLGGASADFMRMASDESVPRRLRSVIPSPKARRGAVARDQRRAAKVRAVKRAKRHGHA